MKSIIRIISVLVIGTILTGFFAQIYQTVNANLIPKIQITEIGANESSANEWIEIFNADETDIDLSGLIFFENSTNHGTTLVQGNKIINPQSYALIVNNYNEFIKTYSVTTDATIFDSSWSSLSESGEPLALILNRETVDSINYTSNTSNTATERILQDSIYIDDWAPSLSSNTMLFENSNTITTETAPDDIPDTTDVATEIIQDTTTGDTDQITDDENTEIEVVDNTSDVEDDSEDTIVITDTVNQTTHEVDSPDPEIIYIEKPEIVISEVSFADSTQDWIEIYINPKNNPVDLQNYNIKIDNIKTQLAENENIINTPTYITIEKNLVATTEEVTIESDTEYLDAVCWTSSTPTASEAEEITQLQTSELWSDSCVNSDVINSNTSIARNTFDFDTNTASDWSNFAHPTKNSSNIIVNNPPSATILVQSGNTEGTAPLSINLDGSSSADSDNDSLKFSWDFGNGEKSESINPETIKFENSGNYKVVLSVEDILGWKSNATIYIKVNSVSASTSGSGQLTIQTNSTNTVNLTNTATKNTPTNLDIKIEIESFLVNPSGVDTESEWITITNVGHSTANLKGWILDDAEGQSKGFTIGNIELSPNESRQFSSKETKIALNNNTDTARLIKPNMEILEQINYSNALDGEIFKKDLETNTWSRTGVKKSTTVKPKATKIATSIENNTTTKITSETLTANIETDSNLTKKTTKSKPAKSTNTNNPQITLDTSGIHITEIFPNPSGTDSNNEWVGIANNGDKNIDIKNWKLQSGSKSYSFDSVKIEPKSEAQIYPFKFLLPNSNAEIKLINPSNQIVDQIKYEKAPDNNSYAKIGDEWQWTKFISPNGQNPEQITIDGMITESNPQNQTFKVTQLANNESLELIYDRALFPENKIQNKLQIKGFALKTNQGNILTELQDVTQKGGGQSATPLDMTYFLIPMLGIPVYVFRTLIKNYLMN